MIVRTIALAGVCVAAAGWSVSASATIIDFSYEASFNNAIVKPLKTLAYGTQKSPLPYIDPEAASGHLNGLLSLRITGYYDTSTIAIIDGDQSVTLFKVAVTSDKFGTVFISNADPELPSYRPSNSDTILTKAANGDFSLSYQLPFLDSQVGTLNLFSKTSIAGKSQRSIGTPASSSLADEGTYFLRGENVSNLYGIQPDLGLGLESFYQQADSYLDHGANVISASTKSIVLDGGSIVLTERDAITPVDPAPPISGAVPEPASWAMMISGIGMAGGAMRRRRKVTTTVRFA